MRWMTRYLELLLLLPALAIAGCGGSGGAGGADTEHGADAGVDAGADALPDSGSAGDTALDGLDCSECDDAGSGPPDSSADTGEDATSLPPPEDHYETLAFTVAHSCVGCEGVSICGRPPMSDNRGITMDAAPNLQTGILFAAERWERAGRVLPLDTCEIVRGEALEPVVHPPEGIEVLDAGDLTFGAAMPLIGEESIVLSYFNATHNYPSVYRPPQSQAGWNEEYLPGAALTLDGAGGADWAGFSLADVAPGNLDILTPHTDPDGKLQSIPTDQALEVTWAGAEDYDDMVIYLQGFFCEGGIDGITFMLLCHAQNDGAYTIPQGLLEDLDWPMYVTLGLSISRKVPLDLAELDPQPAWSVRTWADLPIYHDPSAEQFEPFECAATEMSEGFAGEACAKDTDCGGGCCLPEHNVYYKDGYCSLTGCQEDGDCPTDAACAGDFWDFTPWEKYCAKTCTTEDDCRFPEYACLPTESGETACTPNFF